MYISDDPGLTFGSLHFRMEKKVEKVHILVAIVLFDKKYIQMQPL